MTLLNGTWNGTAFSEKGKAADSIATESTLYDPDGDGTGWYQGTDGWFYYNSPVAPGQSTDNLFDAVKLGDVTKISISRFIRRQCLPEVMRQEIKRSFRF